MAFPLDARRRSLLPPDGWLEVDWSHPYAKDLLFAFAPGVARPGRASVLVPKPVSKISSAGRMALYAAPFNVDVDTALTAVSFVGCFIAPASLASMDNASIVQLGYWTGSFDNWIVGVGVPYGDTAGSMRPHIRNNAQFNYDTASGAYTAVAGAVMAYSGALNLSTGYGQLYDSSGTLKSESYSPAAVKGSDSRKTLSMAFAHSYLFVFKTLDTKRDVDLHRNPWQLFKVRPRRVFVPTGGGTVNLAATGAAAADGNAPGSILVSLAGVGIATASGSGSAATEVPMAAMGFVLADGSATADVHVAAGNSGTADATGTAAPSVSITISAAALAAAAGLAGLSASVLAAGAGAAQAGGYGELATQLYGQAAGAALARCDAVLAAEIAAAAAGSASAAGGAQLSAGAPGELTSHGTADAVGDAMLKARIDLIAQGASQAGGEATLTTTVTLTAAGFVAAMGAGNWRATIPLAAFGNVAAWGGASLVATPGGPTPAPPIPARIAIDVQRLAAVAIQTQPLCRLTMGIEHGW